MFKRKKDGSDDKQIDAAAREANGEFPIARPAIRPEIPAPPVRPAIAEMPRRLPEYGTAATPRRPEPRPEARPALAPTPTPAPGLHDNDGKKLIVGREIVLSGEIRTCDKLVVEGRVEATLADSRAIEIAATGQYKGTAQITTADIAGRFDGDLDVKGRLTVRSTGRVTGMIRYGELEIERGGVISGTLEFIPEAVPQAKARGREAVREQAEEAAARPEPLLDLAGNLPNFGLSTNGKGAATD